MKKLILAIALVISSLSFAQEGRERERGEKLTPEQQSELQVKKMTLDLDLNEKQQKEIKAILLEQAQKREAKIAEFKGNKEKGEKPSADEKFEMKSKMLDEQIEMKAKMKKILTPEQYKEWEENHEKRSEMRSEKMEKMKQKRKGHTEPEE
ncbi:MAG TPA: hypothetical protein VK164_12775 [Flavobacterium sp.]|uniref:Spy/CpxP family protein refolding chaperone n=1 Tax=Flavobacterium sp. TaxID=239 RepID=UPI002B4ABC33|nr:hypothetical protein [Flavobacterium sp.]HLO74803.1 hypothetical protein [Flavobacterium sp.]